MKQVVPCKDAYFEALAYSLMKTILLLAMVSPYPDFLMVYAIVQLPNLLQRLAFTLDTNCQDLWQQVSTTTTFSAQLQYCLSFNAVYSVLVHNLQKAELQELSERIAYAEIMLPDPSTTLQ